MDQLHSAKQSRSSKVSFGDVFKKIPYELVLRVLQHWMSQESLIVEELPAPKTSEPPSILTRQDNVPGEYLVTYTCDTDDDVQTLPMKLQAEYWRLRHLSWLTSPKAFTNPYDFYMSHYLLSLNPQTRLPHIHNPPSTLNPHYSTIHLLIVIPHPNIPTHGLEHVILDFDASQYFALFNVRLPPFDITDTSHRGDELHHDQHLHGAASLLLHCTHLTLIFGEGYRYAHPWYNVLDSAWDEARSRPRVCELGKVVDWILRYAWESGWVQGKKLRLAGEVQGWVREKWERGRGEGIEGIVEDMGRPQDLFPPTCKCEVGCWTLGIGRDATAW